MVPFVLRWYGKYVVGHLCTGTLRPVPPKFFLNADNDDDAADDDDGDADARRCDDYLRKTDEQKINFHLEFFKKIPKRIYMYFVFFFVRLFLFFLLFFFLKFSLRTLVRVSNTIF